MTESEHDPRHELPDAATLAWVARAMDAASAVVVRRLVGGLDAATHLIRAADGREAVLRRATGPRDERREESFRRERDMAALLVDLGMPVARVLADDLQAVDTDVPTLLLSRVPGRLTYPRHPSAAFVSELASAAARVHVQPVPDATWPWNDRSAHLVRTLDEGRHPACATLARLGVPAAPLTFVHGDLWPGNLLFEGTRLSGIVDWGSAGVGHPGVEIAYLAADLRIASDSEDLHDAVLDAYEERLGPLPRRAWWEVAGYLRFPTDPAVWLGAWTEAGLSLTAHDARRRHAAGLASALRRL